MVLKLGKPSSNKSIAIVKNAVCLAAIEIGRNLISVSGTCAFNSITEVFISGYTDIKKFKNYIDNLAEDNILLNYYKLIAIYAKEGMRNKTIYKRRVQLLYYLRKELFQFDNFKLNCECNAVKLFEILMADHTSSYKKRTCMVTECEITISSVPLPVLIVPKGTIYWTEGYRNLIMYMNEYLEEKTKLCI